MQSIKITVLHKRFHNRSPVQHYYISGIHTLIWASHKNGTDQNFAQISVVIISAKIFAPYILEYRQNNLDKHLDDANRLEVPKQAFTSVIHL
jgi:hypothetical protein